jgi:hypothetical protein
MNLVRAALRAAPEGRASGAAWLRGLCLQTTGSQVHSIADRLMSTRGREARNAGLHDG